MKELAYFFTYSLIGIFSLAVVLGVGFQILRQIIGIIAYFTYSGLIYLESFVNIELFIPKKGMKRLIMDLCATMLTGIAAQGIYAFIKHPNESFINDLPHIIPFPFATIGLICAALIYFLGYKSKPKEIEKEEWFDKQNSLDIPKFLKFWE